MKIIITQINRMYAVTTATGCTVTTADGTILCTAQPGKQAYFTAISPQAHVDDEQAVISPIIGTIGAGVSEELRLVALEGSTALGQQAYGLAVSRDEGLQLWGVHLQPSEQFGGSLNIMASSVGLADPSGSGTITLGFDSATTIRLATCSERGSTFIFSAGDGADVQVRKATSAVLEADSLLNRTEGDARWASMPCHHELPALLESAHVYAPESIGTRTDLSHLRFAESEGVQTCELWLTTGESGCTVSWPEHAIWPDESSQSSPTVLAALTAYRFAIRQEPSGKLIITRAYEYTV